MPRLSGDRADLNQTLIARVPTAAAREGHLPTGDVPVAAAVKPYLALWPLPNGRDFGDGSAERDFTYASDIVDGVLRALDRCSGYSIYKSNFSAEASCQALRANIITMLDKKADASTLRMLVQRDLVTFERDCAPGLNSLS